jgi:hypothetical protein
MTSPPRCVGTAPPLKQQPYAGGVQETHRGEIHPYLGHAVFGYRVCDRVSTGNRWKDPPRP